LSGLRHTPHWSVRIPRLLALAVLGGGLVWLASRTAAVREDDKSSAAVSPGDPARAETDQRRVSPPLRPEIASAVDEPALRNSPVETFAPVAPGPASGAQGLLVRVVDEVGAGVQGMTVVAVRAVDFAKGITDADGDVWLDCSAGQYQVTAYDKSDESLYISSQLELVVVEEAGPSHTTLSVCKASARVEAFVCDDAGQPIPGLQLEGFGNATGRTTELQVTDARGIAVWAPVAAGEWTVGIVADESTANLVVQDEPFMVMVEPTGTTRIQISLVRRGELIVRLRDVTDAGELVGVIAASEQESELLLPESATHDPAGDLMFTCMLPPDDYAVVAIWQPGSVWWSRPERVAVRSARSTSAHVRTESAQIRLSGRVLDPSGWGIEGVVISAYPPRSDVGSMLDEALDLLVARQGRSDARGSWSLCIPWESSLIAVDVYGTYGTTGRGDSRAGRYLADTAGLLEVSDTSKELDILVEPGCILAGRVVGRAAVEQTSPRLELILEREGPTPLSRRVRVQSGTFELGHAGAGRYTARLSADGDDVSAAVDFEVAAGFREGETIRLTLDFPD